MTHSHDETQEEVLVLVKLKEGEGQEDKKPYTHTLNYAANIELSKNQKKEVKEGYIVRIVT